MRTGLEIHLAVVTSCDEVNDWRTSVVVFDLICSRAFCGRVCWLENRFDDAATGLDLNFVSIKPAAAHHA
jgi:hypothetical protein